MSIEFTGEKLPHYFGFKLNFREINRKYIRFTILNIYFGEVIGTNVEILKTVFKNIWRGEFK